jgi:DNA-binding LacI/PurR family transcriptional regulator
MWSELCFFGGVMSIKKIAQKAGVSQATVSRVLNNPGYHCSSPEVRERIWKAAMELNYVPNEAARNLKMGVAKEAERTCYISVLMTRTDSAQTDPFFAELLRVVESEIHRQMCILSNVWYQSIFSNDRKCRMSNLDKLVNELYEETKGKCDGLIIIGKCNKDALKKLNEKFQNVVSVNRNSTNHEVDEVTCDGRKVAIQAVEYLVALGHRDIGYVGECHNEARYRGYIDTLTKHDIEIDPSFVYETRQTEAEGYEAMSRFLKAEAMPTGIYCANDITAVGMLKCLAKNKNRYFTPSIISSDDIEEAQYTNPMLTTVGLPKEEMGKFALYLLLDRIKGGHKSVVSMELEGSLVKRGSCLMLSESSWNDYYI